MKPSAGESALSPFTGDKTTRLKEFLSPPLGGLFYWPTPAYDAPMQNQDTYDVVILGAGAAGLMCAAEAGKRGRRVLLLDKADKIGKKILISGGGRCNFTNLHVTPAAYLSQNPHFCKSALARYTPQDFLDLMRKHGLSWHEKTLGQLFCDQKAPAVVEMLWTECREADVQLRLNTDFDTISHEEGLPHNIQLLQTTAVRKRAARAFYRMPSQQSTSLCEPLRFDMCHVTQYISM